MTARPAAAGLFPSGAFSSKAAGTTGAAFLNEPAGARAAALGGAVAASASGAEALFQNPAALARLQPESPSEVALGYDALVETAYQGSAAYARPLGRAGALAAGVLYDSQSPQTYYTAQGDANGTFTPMDLAAAAAYAGRVGPVALGAGLKVLRSSLADRTGTGFAADFGALLPHAADLGDGPLDAGLAVSNLGPPLKIGSSADPLPFRARVGAVWHASPVFDAVLDVVLPVDQDPYTAGGVEARLPASRLGSSRPWTAALRVGYDQSRSRSIDGFTALSFGAGLDLASLRVDYAWQALGALGSSNRVTLAFRF